MGYKHRVEEFHGDKIDFFVNGNDVLILGRSFISAIGLDWSSQLKKIKQLDQLSGNITTMNTGMSIRPSICFRREFITPFFDSFNIKKIKEEKKNKFILYRDHFEQFSYKAVKTSESIEKYDKYMGSEKGLASLVEDSVIWLGNPNAVGQLASILNDLLNKDLFPENIAARDGESVGETKGRFERIIQRASDRVLDAIEPIYDMAFKTADRQAELVRFKSTSISARILEIAEKVREAKDQKALNKLSLDLKVIAKGVR